MNAPLELVIFDCDGTLVDSQHMIWKALGRAFEIHRLDVPPVEETRRVVGLSLFTAVQNLMPGHGDDFIEQVVADYRTAFGQLRQENEQEPLFEGTGEMLDALDRAGYLMGIATGKSARGLQHTLASHNIAHHFSTIQTADGNPSKPSPVMLEKAMEEAGAEPENTVLIGDTSFDMTMAHAAGVYAIGVAWGYHEIPELLDSGADEIVDQMFLLSAIIQDHFGEH
jgi:phosphoglycolate phosphatase